MTTHCVSSGVERTPHKTKSRRFGGTNCATPTTRLTAVLHTQQHCITLCHGYYSAIISYVNIDIVLTKFSSLYYIQSSSTYIVTYPVQRMKSMLSPILDFIKPNTEETRSALESQWQSPNWPLGLNIEGVSGSLQQSSETKKKKRRYEFQLSLSVSVQERLQIWTEHSILTNFTNRKPNSLNHFKPACSSNNLWRNLRTYLHRNVELYICNTLVQNHAFF